MALKFAILGLLSTFGELSGYDIKQRFTESVSNVWEADLSQIYRTLDRLEQQELVASKPDPDSNRGRKVYHVTAQGQASLRVWLQEDYELALVRDPALLRMFFARQVPLKRLIEQVKDYRAQFVKLEGGYAAIEDILTALVQEGWEDAFYQKLTLDLGHRYTQMTIDWCDYVLDMLEEKKNQQDMNSDNETK